MALKLNETPIKTAECHKINNISLDVELPTQASHFTSYTWEEKNVKLTHNTEKAPFVYGNGVVLEDNMKKYCNSDLAIFTTSEAQFAIRYTFNDENTVLSDTIEIVAEHDATFTLVYESTTKKPCYHNSMVKIQVLNNAKVQLEYINLLNDTTNHFVNIESNVHENANLDLIMVDMGAKNSISNIYTNMLSKKAVTKLQTAYIASNAELKDMNYISHLRGKKSEIDMDIQGVLDDQSKKNLKFTIDFISGCNGAKGTENESCMMLSDSVRNISLPILLCTEEDVEGAHSASAGQADSEQVFYIMSRGFSKKEAISMLVHAKYTAIIEALHDKKLQKEVMNEINRRLA